MRGDKRSAGPGGEPEPCREAEAGVRPDEKSAVRPDQTAEDRQEEINGPCRDQDLLRSGQADSGPGRTRGGRIGLALAGTAVLAGAAGLALAPTTHSGGTDQVKAITYGQGSGHAQPDRATSASRLRVVSVTPSAGSRAVSGVGPLQVVFSAALAPHSPLPVLTPAVPGQWQISGGSVTFTPAAAIAPSMRVTLRIPAGQAGVESAAGGLLAKAVVVHFKTAAYSRLRLAQLLGQLGYLPMSWQPSAGGRLLGGPAGSTLVGQQIMAYSPPRGTFRWSVGYPSVLRGQWRPGRSNPLTRGAVMAFEAQHRLAINGTASRRVWHALFIAAADQRPNDAGYTYAIASKGSPETLTIWHNGRIVLKTLANTGIPVAPTAAGTYPVYLRYRFQIMQGFNPDGSHYADSVSFVSYFDGGEAVHYFPRGSYGFPQSLGCVELPYDSAARAWPYLTYGSLVTVTG